MTAVLLNDILTDARVLYDVNKDTKANKLSLYTRQTIDYITAQVPGYLTNATAALVVSGGQITFPADFEVAFALFSGTQEVLPIDPFSFQRFNARVSVGAPYGQVRMDGSGNIIMELKNIGDGTTLDLAYKRRTDDITTIPNVLRYIVLDGVSWRYEKYEQKLEFQIYRGSKERFEDAVLDIAVKFQNQDNHTNKFNYLNEWTLILSRI